MTTVLGQRISRAEAAEYDRVLGVFGEGCRYTDEHFDQLVKRYGNKWIAVHRTTVLGGATTTAGLLRVLLRSKRPPPEVCVTFITRQNQVLIL